MGAAGEMWPFFRPNFTNMERYLRQHAPATTACVAFIPTGWADSSSYNRRNCTQRHKDLIVNIVPYSEHSNFEELCEFVAFLKPQHVVPTVFSDDRSRLNMLKQFASLVNSSAAKRQFLCRMLQTPQTPAKRRRNLPAARDHTHVASSGDAAEALCTRASPQQPLAQEAQQAVSVKLEREAQVGGRAVLARQAGVRGRETAADARQVVCIDSDGDGDGDTRVEAHEEGLRARGEERSGGGCSERDTYGAKGDGVAAALAAPVTADTSLHRGRRRAGRAGRASCVASVSRNRCGAAQETQAPVTAAAKARHTAAEVIDLRDEVETEGAGGAEGGAEAEVTEVGGERQPGAKAAKDVAIDVRAEAPGAQRRQEKQAQQQQSSAHKQQTTLSCYFAKQ